MTRAHAWAWPLLLCLTVGTVRADDAPAPAQASAAQAEGRRLFAEAAARMAAGRTDLRDVRDFHIDLEDVHIERRGSQHDGYLRIDYLAPDKFRWEQRRRKADLPTIKVLDGSRLWISTVDSEGKRRWAGKHGRPGGAEAVRQVRKDRDRFANLARFLALGGLDGPGVTFTYAGTFSRPADHAYLAGTWLKVSRRAPAGKRMAFLFTPEERPDGRPHAGWPAAALVVGDPKRGVPTEHYRLWDWRNDDRTPRPRKIERWTRDLRLGTYRRTMLAFPVVLRINEGIAEDRFRPSSGGSVAR